MILHVLKSNIYSGAENVVCQIINGLKEQEEFIYMAPHGPIEDKLKSLNLYEHYYGIDKLDISSIKDAVSNLHPTVVHAHDFTASILCALALKNTVPIVSHLHNNPPWIKNINIKSLAYRYSCKYYSHVLMVSDAVKDEYRYTKSIKCPITVLGNPFSVESVVSQVDTTAHGLDSDILFVGRLVEQKNPLLFAEIAKDLIERGVASTARVVGDGELMGELKSFVEVNSLQEKLVLEGFKKNSYDYMANTKIQIMPSKWEGFGLVALEAMSLGKPVLGTSNGGLCNIIDDSCGHICDTKVDYVNAAIELLSDYTLYQQKSIDAKKRAKEYDNISNYCKKLYSIYHEL
ncbi:MAG: glycosyltransferase [Pseudobutyrivibrio sp.]|nr:glycosyltransferase [Pseudobutyrivibrio sp.]